MKTLSFKFVLSVSQSHVCNTHMWTAAFPLVVSGWTITAAAATTKFTTHTVHVCMFIRSSSSNLKLGPGRSRHCPLFRLAQQGKKREILCNNPPLPVFGPQVGPAGPAGQALRAQKEKTRPGWLLLAGTLILLLLLLLSPGVQSSSVCSCSRPGVVATAPFVVVVSHGVGLAPSLPCSAAVAAPGLGGLDWILASLLTRLDPHLLLAAGSTLD